MNLKRCEKKHYYDGDKFEECPYCISKTRIGYFDEIAGPHVMNKEDEQGRNEDSGNAGYEKTVIISEDS
ncbi:MAG: hypothetical protein K6F75_02575 [Butyrivibrio sp.]|nr:hypothetical protein [Butyrivibrio sp.]